MTTLPVTMAQMGINPGLCPLVEFIFGFFLMYDFKKKNGIALLSLPDLGKII